MEYFCCLLAVIEAEQVAQRQQQRRAQRPAARVSSDTYVPLEDLGSGRAQDSKEEKKPSTCLGMSEERSKRVWTVAKPVTYVVLHSASVTFLYFTLLYLNTSRGYKLAQDKHDSILYTYNQTSLMTSSGPLEAKTTTACNWKPNGLHSVISACSSYSKNFFAELLNVSQALNITDPSIVAYRFKYDQDSISDKTNWRLFVAVMADMMLLIDGLLIGRINTASSNKLLQQVTLFMTLASGLMAADYFLSQADIEATACAQACNNFDYTLMTTGESFSINGQWSADPLFSSILPVFVLVAQLLFPSTILLIHRSLKELPTLFDDVSIRDVLSQGATRFCGLFKSASQRPVTVDTDPESELRPRALSLSAIQ